MRERLSSWSHALPSDIGELVLLFVELFAALVLIGWAYNRGFRAAERGPVLRWPLLIIGYALALVVRSVPGIWWQTVIIAVAVLLAGLFERGGHARGLAVPVVLLATLLGYGAILSAIALTLVIVIALLLSPARKR